MRDPERTMVCDIIANGTLDAMIGKDRYAVKQETEEELRARFAAKYGKQYLDAAPPLRECFFDFFKEGANR